jgi:hypothetical protein
MQVAGLLLGKTWECRQAAGLPYTNFFDGRKGQMQQGKYGWLEHIKECRSKQRIKAIFPQESLFGTETAENLAGIIIQPRLDAVDLFLGDRGEVGAQGTSGLCRYRFR